MSITVAQNALATVTLGNDEILLIGRDIVIAPTTGAGITTTMSASVYNDGIIASDGKAIEFNGSFFCEVFNAGTIFSQISTVAVKSIGKFEFMNTGTIHSDGSFLNASGATNTLRMNNSGDVHAKGFFLVANTDGLDDLKMHNTGDMYGAYGFDMNAGVHNRLINSGDITTEHETILQDQGAGLEITNRGSIASLVGVAISCEGAGGAKIRNSGDITGDVTLGRGTDEIVNKGLIDGDVDLGAAGDVFRGLGGAVTGLINGGGGNDKFFVDQAGVEIDGGGSTKDMVYARNDVVSVAGVEFIYLRGGANIDATGDDNGTKIYGNKGDNTLTGGAHNDHLYGRAGKDELIGDALDDWLYGGAGNDTLDGGKNFDDLHGGAGSDVLIGGSGEDLLMGGGGNDELRGGTDRDTLNGGSGSDRFVFATAKEAGKSVSQADVIQDFERGKDAIDLSEMIAGRFDFVGNSAFSGSGPEVRVFKSGSNAFALLDVDGDNSIDARILVKHVATLTASDFIL